MVQLWCRLNRAAAAAKLVLFHYSHMHPGYVSVMRRRMGTRVRARVQSKQTTQFELSFREKCSDRIAFTYVCLLCAVYNKHTALHRNMWRGTQRVARKF